MKIVLYRDSVMSELNTLFQCDFHKNQSTNESHTSKIMRDKVRLKVLPCYFFLTVAITVIYRMTVNGKGLVKC